ncbi:alpha/beta fold hydrolase [Minwuia sp.]|uniref:alpha/beta fold hydrolase n=1 Tax=Minwuia sp. TaxID=2493630 RepID=UPI003A8CA57F
MNDGAYIDRGTGAPIVFLHGIGGNADNWLPQINELFADFRCIAWNMPGYGGNPAVGEMTFAGMADALAGLLDELGLETATFCGLSMGGYLAQEVLARHPERVRALILMCTSASFGKPGGDFQTEFLAARLKPLDAGKTPADIAPKLAAGMASPKAGPEVAGALIASMQRIPAETYRAALNCLVTFDRSDNVKNIACPALLIAGEEDKTAPAAVMERMAQRIDGAAFHVIPEAGHIANIEAPAATNRLIADFMKELDA